jgi:hypothetical protein
VYLFGKMFRRSRALANPAKDLILGFKDLKRRGYVASRKLKDAAQ